MELTFPWPTSQGEWLAWSSAAVTVLFGLVAMFAPRLTFRMLRLRTIESRPEALSESRARLAGFYLGVGVASLLLAQPLVYLALGLAWAFTAFGRFISILSDGGSGPYNWIMLAVEIALAAMPLVLVFELVA